MLDIFEIMYIYIYSINVFYVLWVSFQEEIKNRRSTRGVQEVDTITRTPVRSQNT